MSEQLYSIKEQTLTDIANALRRHHGDTKIVVQEVEEPVMEILKTSNATGFDNIGSTELGAKCLPVRIEGASSIKVRLAYNTKGMLQTSTIQLAAGYYESTGTFPTAGTTDYSGASTEIAETIFEGTDSVTMNIKGSIVIAAYYAEITGLDADGNEICRLVEKEVEVENTYTSSEMAGAIDNIVGAEVVIEPVIQALTVESNATYGPPEGVDGFNPVIVNVPQNIGIIEAITIEENGVYNVPDGVDGYNPITVNVPQGGGELPEEAFVISDDCSYRFSYGGWDWFIEEYGDRMSTNNVTNARYMFSSSKLKEIPFEINCNPSVDDIACTGFISSSDITKAPYINGTVGNINNCFYFCFYLNEIPEDWAERIDWSTLHSSTNLSCNAIFSYCYSLKNIPTSLLAELWSLGVSGSNVPYGSMFSYCYSLAKANEIAIQQGTITSNRCSSMFNSCGRLKSATFVTQSDGTPCTANWKSQTIDLSTSVGYIGATNWITQYNSGITADKEVTDDATYQALKDDPDWYTEYVAYSRYNHDSAVETINSPPDTSAYLTTYGGTNTIKFTGSAGSATDGGAINTLTEEEIAVATAKGWTVTLV